MKKIVLFVVFLICLALVAAVILNLDKILEPDGYSDADNPTGNENSVSIGGEDYLPRRNVKNYLIMGIDEFGDADDKGIAQVDFLLVLSFDGDKNSYTMLSVNRDTMTEVVFNDYFGGKPRTEVAQIALSHNDGTYNGITNHSKCLNTARAVSGLLYGVEFDGYVSMTMDAVKRVVDFIGGVPIKLDEDMTEIDPALVEGETVVLDGELALNFIRARGGLEDSSNTARMERQKLFLAAFIDAVDRFDADEEELARCYEQASPYMVSEDGVDTFDELFGKISSYECGEMLSLPGEAVMGEEFMEFYVDVQGVEEIVKNVFFKKAE